MTYTSWMCLPCLHNRLLMFIVNKSSQFPFRNAPPVVGIQYSKDCRNHVRAAIRKAFPEYLIMVALLFLCLYCSSHCKAAHGGHPAIALCQCLKPERGPIVSLTTNSSRTAFYRVTIRITTKCHYYCLIGADSGVLNCPRPPNLLAPLIDVLAKSSTEVLKLRI